MDGTFNPGKQTFGIPYHANTGVPDWIFYIFIIFMIYVLIRVILDYRRKTRSDSNKAEREIDAIKGLLGDKIKKKAKQKMTKSE